MGSFWLAALTFFTLSAGGWFKNTVLQRPTNRTQQSPDWFSRKADWVWKGVAIQLLDAIRARRDRLHGVLTAEVGKLPRGSVDFPEITEGETTVTGSYGMLPEVLVDQGTGAIFPVPLPVPERVSWFQMANLAARLSGRLPTLEFAVQYWRTFPKADRIRRFREISGPWDKMNSELIDLTRRIRYLESWIPSLTAQWDAAEAEGRPLESETLVKAIQMNDPRVFDDIRELLRPRRLMMRPFLADRLEDFPGGIISLDIVTDITSPRFLEEVEGAVITHWNQSPWARKHSVSLHLRWVKQPADAAFAAGTIDLREHLGKFPKDRAAMTTGGLTTQVRGTAMILGPGKITPRTLAHELGHLLGFGDCYLRTLSGQGFFGLAVLEWDNPVFPDDLMCDNSVGVLREEAW